VIPSLVAIGGLFSGDLREVQYLVANSKKSPDRNQDWNTEILSAARRQPQALLPTRRQPTSSDRTFDGVDFRPILTRLTNTVRGTGISMLPPSGVFTPL